MVLSAFLLITETMLRGSPNYGVLEHFTEKLKRKRNVVKYSLGAINTNTNV